MVICIYFLEEFLLSFSSGFAFSFGNGLPSIFSEIKPNFVLVIADRFENMSIAIAASYMNIPCIHTQGGEVTGSIDEKVRHAVTKLSDIHFVSNQESSFLLSSATTYIP